MRFPLLGVVVGTLICLSCGGGNGTPTSPTNPTAPPVATTPPPGGTTNPNQIVRFFIQTRDGQPSGTVRVGAALLLDTGAEYSDGRRLAGNAFSAFCQIRSSNTAVLRVIAGNTTSCPPPGSSSCESVAGVSPGTVTLTCHDFVQIGAATPSTPFQVTVQ